MNHPKACPPHVRVVFCDGCHEYVELAGVTCTGPHLGDAACATVDDCPRCSEDPEAPAWCSHCNGYGSSLKEEADRCTHCGGTGLSA